MKKFTVLLIIIFGHLLVSGCATQSDSDSLPSYRTARAQSNLELPPDLINTSSEALKRRDQKIQTDTVLPIIEGVDIKRNENGERWLAISANADTTWETLVEYTLQAGLPILTQSKINAIIETDWIGDETVGSGLKSLLGIFGRGGRASVNDKYTFWLERTTDEQTALYVSHKQLKQVAKNRAVRDEIVETTWIEIPGEGIQTLSMLRDIKTFFGGDSDTDVSDDVVLITSDSPSIILRDDVEIAHDRVRKALIASGYELVSEKPKKNLIVFREIRIKGGVFSRLVPRPKQGVKVEAYGASGKAKVTVTASSGSGIASSKSLPVLYQLAGELRK